MNDGMSRLARWAWVRTLLQSLLCRGVRRVAVLMAQVPLVVRRVRKLVDFPLST